MCIHPVNFLLTLPGVNGEILSYCYFILFFCIFTLVSNSASSFMVEIALGEVLISFLTWLQIACAEGEEVTPRRRDLLLASGLVTSPLAAHRTCLTVRSLQGTHVQNRRLR